MSDTELSGDYEFSLDQHDETGAIMFRLEVGDDRVSFIAGDTQLDAAELASVLETLAAAARKIADDWEEQPDTDNDGFVSFGRGGYYATLAGKTRPDSRHGGYPSREIAAYELARDIAGSGWYPNVWLERERGGYDPIGAEVYAHITEDDTLRPLPGARYEEGEIVSVAGDDWPTWVVDGDYGELGVMLHTRGDPTVTQVATHDQLTPYDDGGDDDE